MGKKIEAKEKFIVINGEDYYASYQTLALAKTAIQDSEFDGAIIYKVVQAWEARFPEEPEIEFYELTLEQV